MIKLKDLIIEGWNSNLWKSDLWNSHLWNSNTWNSDIWNPGMSSHHSDESPDSDFGNLNEIYNEKIETDYSEINDEMQQEFLSGQKYQTWRLIPARDILLLWATFSKYGRVDEDKLDKIWDIIKENVLKICINTEVWNGSRPEFFQKDNYNDITDEEHKRHAYFISDRSNNKWIRNFGEVEGNSRYSDQYQRLYNLLEKCYSLENPEELLVGIDTILNFVHGLGHMAKWFVEGGTDTLDKIRDFQSKGIHLQGKLSESKLNEIEGFLNFWVLPDGKIEKVKDHIGWFLVNVDQDKFHMNDDDMIITDDGSMAEEEEIYQEAFKLGYVRMVKKPEENYPLYIDYSSDRPPSNLQWRNIKNFAIENHWQLTDGIRRKDVEL